MSKPDNPIDSSDMAFYASLDEIYPRTPAELPDVPNHHIIVLGDGV